MSRVNPSVGRLRGLLAFTAILTASLMITLAASAFVDIGAWTPSQSLPEAMADPAVVVHAGWVYVFGGKDVSDDATRDVHVAQIQPNGELGAWQTGRSLPVPVYAHRVASTSTHVYVVGGFDGSQVRKEVWRAAFLSGGQLGEWVKAADYPVGIVLHEAVTWGDHLFVIGGTSGQAADRTASIWRATIQADGGLGPWQSVLSLPRALYRHAVMVHEGVLYVSGGYDGVNAVNTIYYATLGNDGSIGAWKTKLMPIAREYHQIAAHDGRLIVIGGRNGSTVGGVSIVDAAPIAADGSLGTWTSNTARPEPNIPRPLYRLGAVAVRHGLSDFIIILGGLSGGESGYRAEVFRSALPPTFTPTPTATPTPGGDYIPTAPELRFINQIGGSTTAIAKKANHVFVGIGPRLVALNVVNPQQPLFTGQTDVFLDLIRDIVIWGDHAYVAAGANGLRIIRISNPANLVEVAAIALAGVARGLAVSDGYVFVTNGYTGFHVIDVSNPAQPVQKAFAQLPISSTAVLGIDSIAGFVFVVDGVNLLTYDVSDLSQPILRGHVKTAGYAADVAVSGGYAYVADGSGLVAVDVRAPANPIVAGNLALSGNAQKITLGGQRAYLASGSGSIHEVDISNPTQPQRVGGGGTTGNAVAVAVIPERIAYVVDWLARPSNC